MAYFHNLKVYFTFSPWLSSDAFDKVKKNVHPISLNEQWTNSRFVFSSTLAHRTEANLDIFTWNIISEEWFGNKGERIQNTYVKSKNYNFKWDGKEFNPYPLPPSWAGGCHMIKWWLQNNCLAATARDKMLFPGITQATVTYLVKITYQQTFTISYQNIVATYLLSVYNQRTILREDKSF